MQEHRQIEEYGERETGDVLPGTQIGRDGLDPRGQQDRDQSGHHQPRRPNEHVDAADLADPEGSRLAARRRRAGFCTLWFHTTTLADGPVAVSYTHLRAHETDS